MDYQQGDVLIKGIAALPKGCKQVARENGVIIVAKGENTGHAHVIVADKAVLYELKGELYMEVAEPVVITHEEHKAIPIPEGIYQIGRVKERDYLQDMERAVRD